MVAHPSNGSERLFAGSGQAAEQSVAARQHSSCAGRSELDLEPRWDGAAVRS